MSTRTKHIIGMAIVVATVIANWVFGPGGPAFKTGVSATAVVALLTQINTAIGGQS